jgi:hypothetical protein
MMGDQPKRVEEVTLRLAAIQDELLALSPGPSPERFQLLTERDALRETAATFEDDSDDHRSIEALQAELASLEHQRNTILDTRSGYVTSKGGSARRRQQLASSASPSGSPRSRMRFGGGRSRASSSRFLDLGFLRLPFRVPVSQAVSVTANSLAGSLGLVSCHKDGILITSPGMLLGTASRGKGE